MKLKRIVVREFKADEALFVDSERICTMSGEDDRYIRIRTPDGVLSDRMCIRSGGEFDGKALYLPSRFNYEIGLDSVDHIVLVALEKEE